MKSLLHQDLTPFSVPASCSALPCRTEVPVTVRSNGRMYRFILRDKVVPEDPFLILVKASAFAIQQREAYNGRSPERSVKDFMIKDTVVI